MNEGDICMKTMFDYLDYYKELSFEDYPFNDMDNLVFSTLIYLPLKKINSKKDMTIDEVANFVLSKSEIKNTSKSIKWSAIKVLECILNSKRYGDVMFCNYVSILDDKTQFGAVTFRFGKNNCYIAFKGTDNSLTGWKEDLELSYIYPVMAQSLAVSYLKDTLRFSDKVVYVGGHSKGGNLAMASVMESDKKVFDRIKTVYNNDGPGFKKKQFESSKYRKMSSKLKMFIPEESLVGILLYNFDNYLVVKSNEVSIMQHYPTSWGCFGQFFEKGKLSKNSIKMKNEILNFLDNTSDKNKKCMVDTFFDVLKKSGIKYFYEVKNLKFSDFSLLVKEAKGVDEESKKILLEMVKKLIFKD